jgi:hypothetical protein
MQQWLIVPLHPMTSIFRRRVSLVQTSRQVDAETCNPRLCFSHRRRRRQSQLSLHKASPTKPGEGGAIGSNQVSASERVQLHRCKQCSVAAVLVRLHWLQCSRQMSNRLISRRPLQMQGTGAVTQLHHRGQRIRSPPA